MCYYRKKHFRFWKCFFHIIQKGAVALSDAPFWGIVKYVPKARFVHVGVLRTVECEVAPKKQTLKEESLQQNRKLSTLKFY